MTRIHGLVVATVTPYHPDGAIDWPSFDRMLDHVCAEPGVTGIFVNGHAGDASLLTPEERKVVIARAAARRKPHQTLFAGAVAMSTAGVCHEARVAEDQGVDVIVPFPAPAMAQGAMASDTVPMAFFEAVARATSLPLSIFQMPLGSGLGMRTDTLVRLVRTFPIVAIKEGSDTIVAYEDNFFAIRAANPDVAILPSSYDFFLSQLAVGADGILSGLGSLAPRLLGRLWAAAQAGNLAEMRAVNEELYPLIRVIYGAKVRMHMHTRIKAGLQAMGIIAGHQPRGPLVALSAAEEAEIAAVVGRFAPGTL
jgi:4-hydroxy-tetrahydrodipicolinate synthase